MTVELVRLREEVAKIREDLKDSKSWKLLGINNMNAVVKKFSKCVNIIRKHKGDKGDKANKSDTNG